MQTFFIITFLTCIILSFMLSVVLFISYFIDDGNKLYKMLKIIDFLYILAVLSFILSVLSYIYLLFTASV